MAGGVVRRYKRLILLLLLLSPSIAFVADYAVNSASPFTVARQFILTSADQNYTVRISVAHPPYLITGQAIPVNVSVKIQFTAPYSAIYVQDVRVEFRDPTSINSTTGAVQGWRVFSVSNTSVGTNYTSPKSLSRLTKIPATYPPSSSPFDSFLPSQRIAINGAADLIVYQISGNTTSSSSVSLSILDDQAVYQTQLSTIRSAASWIVYQLTAAVAISLVYLRVRATEAPPADKVYSLQLESYKVQRELAKLDELMNSHRIGEDRYNELKQRYEKELVQLRTADKSTST